MRWFRDFHASLARRVSDCVFLGETPLVSHGEHRTMELVDPQVREYDSTYSMAATPWQSSGVYSEKEEDVYKSFVSSLLALTLVTLMTPAAVPRDIYCTDAGNLKKFDSASPWNMTTIGSTGVS